MIESDDALFPVLIQVWCAPYTDDEIRASTTRQRAHAQRAIAEGVYVCSLVGDGDALDSRQRKLIADLTNEMSSLERERSIVSCVVVRSTVIRGVLTALKWFLKDRIEPVNSEEEAVATARRAYEDNNLPVPAALTDGRALARLKGLHHAKAANG